MKGIRFIPAVGKKRDIIVLIDRKAQVIDYINEDPLVIYKQKNTRVKS